MRIIKSFINFTVYKIGPASSAQWERVHLGDTVIDWRTILKIYFKFV